MSDEFSKTTKLERRLHCYPNAVEKGQGLLELALVILILILVVSGIVDLGRVLFYYQAMRDAAQEGAAYGSAFPVLIDDDTDPPTMTSNCGQIYQRIEDNLPDDNINIAVFIENVDCKADTFDLRTACAPNNLKIEIRKPDFPIIMPVSSFFVGSTVALDASITATIIQPYCNP